MSDLFAERLLTRLGWFTATSMLEAMKIKALFSWRKKSLWWSRFLERGNIFEISFRKVGQKHAYISRRCFTFGIRLGDIDFEIWRKNQHHLAYVISRGTFLFSEPWETALWRIMPYQWCLLSISIWPITWDLPAWTRFKRYSLKKKLWKVFYIMGQ